MSDHGFFLLKNEKGKPEPGSGAIRPYYTLHGIPYPFAQLRLDGSLEKTDREYIPLPLAQELIRLIHEESARREGYARGQRDAKKGVYDATQSRTGTTPEGDPEGPYGAASAGVHLGRSTP